MATCKSEIHLNDEGTAFDVTITECLLVNGILIDVPVDISTATLSQIKMKPPVGDTKIFTAIVIDAPNGVIRYITEAVDLDELKGWKIQGRVEMPTGKWGSVVDSFTVHENL